MEFATTSLSGLIEINGAPFTDRRGTFVKVFHDDLFKEAGIDFRLAEQYFSSSHANVIRGMHFQHPPHDHAKLVYCAHGKVLDVVLDLRIGTDSQPSTYGKCAAFELSPRNGRALYIPSGFAHGFVGLTDESLMVYNVSTVYERTADMGIRWDSFGFSWPIIPQPILSDRDAGFVQFRDFQSPFRVSG